MKSCFHDLDDVAHVRAAPFCASTETLAYILRFHTNMKRYRKISVLLFAATLCLLQGCAHEPTKEKPISGLKDSRLTAQMGVLHKAITDAGLPSGYLLVEVPSANNDISSALAAMWGMDGTPVAGTIGGMIDKNLSHFGVMGASARMNIAAVQAALKAAEPGRRSTDIFVFVGDAKPDEGAPPAGIKVHWVRADGSLWP